MSLESDLIKHQIFLDRLVLGLHKEYKKYLRKANRYINRNLKKVTTQLDVIFMTDELDRIFAEANNKIMKLIGEFVNQEVGFNIKVLKKHLRITLDTIQESIITEQIPIRTHFSKQSMELKQAFDTFALKKRNEYQQELALGVYNAEEKEELQARAKEKTEGLFSTQNLALMGLAVLAASAAARKQVVREENQLSQKQIIFRWSSVLEANTCPYCEGLHGQFFTSDTLPTYPAHARCQCSLILEEHAVPQL